MASDGERIANVVLGGGEAGKYIAWELAKLGRPVVVVERALIGGSCPNIACPEQTSDRGAAPIPDAVPAEETNT